MSNVPNPPKGIFRHDLHWELWNWLAKNPTQSKMNYPKRNPHILHDCHACEWAVENGVVSSYPKCSKCPFGSFEGKGEHCLNGLYENWWHSRTDTERSELAKEIRDLPLRTDWVWTDVKPKDVK